MKLIAITDSVSIMSDQIAELQILSGTYLQILTKYGKCYAINADYKTSIFETRKRLVAEIDGANK